MNVFHHHLVGVAHLCLHGDQLVEEARGQIKIHQAIRGGKKPENSFEKVLFVSGQRVEIFAIVRKINLFRFPKTGELRLVETSQVHVLDGKQSEATKARVQKRIDFRHLCFLLSRTVVF